MSKNNVKVTVKLVDSFSKTLKRLERQLDKIDAKQVRPEFKIDDNGSIDRIKREIDTIEDQVNTKLNILGKGSLKETQASVESLSGIENVYVKVHDHEVTSAIAKMNAMKRSRRVRRNAVAGDSFMQNVQGATSRASAAEGKASRREGPRAGPWSLEGAAQREQQRRLQRAVTPIKEQMRRRGPKIPSYGHLQSGNKSGGKSGRRGALAAGGVLALSGLRNFMSPGSGANGDGPSQAGVLGNKIWGRLIPRGQATQDMAAFMMPFQYTAIVAGLGAIAAATGPVVAGIGAMSLGILGFGENAADSLHLGKVRLRLFGRELFKVFKPASKTFAPWMDEWLKTVPHALGRELIQPLQDMVVWKPTLEATGAGLTAWTRDFLNLMNDMEPTISRIFLALGQDTGSGLLRLFRWLLVELDQNYDVIKNALSAMKEFAIFMYRIFLMWTQAIANLSPIFKSIGGIINAILGAPVLGALVSWILAAGILLAVMFKIMAVFGAIAAFVTGAFVAKIVASMVFVVGALSAVYAALFGVGVIASYVMSVLTLGAALVAGLGAASYFTSQFGGGSSDMGSGGNVAGLGSGGQSTNMGGNTINFYGNPDHSTLQKVKDIFPEEHSNESHINGTMTKGQ